MDAGAGRIASVFFESVILHDSLANMKLQSVRGFRMRMHKGIL